MGSREYNPLVGQGDKAPVAFEGPVEEPILALACFIETLMFMPRKFGGAKLVLFGG